MLTHISILLILGGGVIRGVWGEKGYLEFREGQTVAQFVDDRGVRPLPFAVHLADFEIETDAAPTAAAAATGGHDQCNELLVRWPEKNLTARLPVKLGEEQNIGEGEQAFRIKILQYIPDFLINMETREVTTRSHEPRNPAILVAVAGPAYSNHRWLFAKFPDFTMHTPDSEAKGPSPLQLTYLNHGAAAPARLVNGPIKNFRSSLKVIEGDSVAHEQSIAVNSPMRYKGYTFYQSGYNPRDLSYTSLQVVKDPGVPVVYAGFAFMIGGLFLVFYLNPWLDARRKA